VLGGRTAAESSASGIAEIGEKNNDSLVDCHFGNSDEPVVIVKVAACAGVNHQEADDADDELL
jgi:hypothetical protein